MYKELYKVWLQKADSLYQEELKAISKDDKAIADRFYQYVSFGTGGMREKLGGGTNRINTHTIRLAAEGLAQQITAQGDIAKARGVVIAYDTRHFSQEFAYETAGVLAANGIQSYLFKESRPTPELSFAVRYLAAYAGVVITASHNPKEYNGFKVYGEDGAQLTPKFADEIVAYMEAVENIFAIHTLSKQELQTSGYCIEILEKLDDAYNEALKTLVPTIGDKELKLVYTPLHGAGLVPTKRALTEAGFMNMHIVIEQAHQDGEFSTVNYPNPEEAASFEIAIELGNKVGAELLLATDPDADRLGVAVKNENSYNILTGNQLGALLLNYILLTKQQNGDLGTNSAVIKTIVTSELGTAIANSYGIRTFNTLTGFKFITEKIAEFEATGENTFLFGYEESYGYLAGSFVRDKDAVQIALLTAEMAECYKKQGITLLDALHNLYDRYGFYQEALLSFTFEGIDGQKRITSIMEQLRKHPPIEFAGIAVTQIEDYYIGNLNGLPKADVVKFILEDDTWICVRPSGTEPKCKVYIGVVKTNAKEAKESIEILKQTIHHTLEV
ncbi:MULTISPECIES: phospho-sugar mutase [Lysinibacillus]|uniref:Phosphoglucomutase n=1 Tax=Lysinibacillus xylanilyticus TaxID=582475 RepID=A0ABV3VX12_9BACI